MTDAIDTKRCPYCAEEIRAAAIKCRYCGSRIEGRPALLEWTRSRDSRILGGVCGGLAEHFDIPATALRLAFVVAFLLGFGIALPIYVVLWIIMPIEEEPWPPQLEARRGAGTPPPDPY